MTRHDTLICAVLTVSAQVRTRGQRLSSTWLCIVVNITVFSGVVCHGALLWRCALVLWWLLSHSHGRDACSAVLLQASVCSITLIMMMRALR
jgi:hypothetical protein